MDKNEQIRQRAHQIWEAEGCPDDQEADHWRQAEEQLRGEGVLDDADAPEDVMASPQGDIAVSGQADGRVITEEEGGLTDLPDEAQEAMDDPVTGSNKRARKQDTGKP